MQSDRIAFEVGHDGQELGLASLGGTGECCGIAGWVAEHELVEVWLKAADVDEFGNRFSASYIDQFFDKTLGISIGYAHSDNPIQENQVGLYEPWQPIGTGWRPNVPAGTWYSDGIKALRRTGYTKRDGVMATLQFRPSDAWESTIENVAMKPIVATVSPDAPAATCRRAISGDLCVLAWGRRDTPEDCALEAMPAMFISSTSSP